MTNTHTIHHSNHIRIVAISSFIASGIGGTLNIVFGADFSPSIVPYTQIITPVINLSTSLISLFVFLFPNSKKVVFSTIFIQACYNVMTGFETVGIMLYSFLMLLLFCWGYLRNNFKKKVFSLIVIWFLVLFTVIPFGIERFIFAIGISILTFATYVCLYDILYDQLHFLVSQVSVTSNQCKLKLPEKGGKLNLKELGLTERQIACVKYINTTNMTYKEIAEKLIISESAVKKDMQDLFKLFGVKNKETLKFLMIQYSILY